MRANIAAAKDPEPHLVASIRDGAPIGVERHIRQSGVCPGVTKVDMTDPSDILSHAVRGGNYRSKASTGLGPHTRARYAWWSKRLSLLPWMSTPLKFTSWRMLPPSWSLNIKSCANRWLWPVQSEAEGFNKQIAGLLQEQRRPCRCRLVSTRVQPRRRPI